MRPNGVSAMASSVPEFSIAASPVSNPKRWILRYRVTRLPVGSNSNAVLKIPSGSSRRLTSRSGAADGQDGTCVQPDSGSVLPTPERCRRRTRIVSAAGRPASTSKAPQVHSSAARRCRRRHPGGAGHFPADLR